MLDSSRFYLFLTAALLLAIAPGPGMLYVLARSLAGGKREGVLSAFGTFLGGMVHVFAAALGVSIVLARSAIAFATVKYAGAAYLGFLGVRMILDARKKKRTQTRQQNRQQARNCPTFPKARSPREIRSGRAWRLKF
jgi:threonine/homoserine/homoserine lactone efflux protein